MLRWFWRLNRWYDGLDRFGPDTRFLSFMGVMTVIVFAPGLTKYLLGRDPLWVEVSVLALMLALLVGRYWWTSVRRGRV